LLIRGNVAMAASLSVIGFYNAIATENQEALRLDLARVTPPHCRAMGAQ